jgi:protein SCO1/2
VFRDEAGRQVRLGDFFGSRPVILVLEYLKCPNLCGFVLGALVSALDETPLAAGRDYEVVALSIDAREGPADAASAKRHYLERAVHPAPAAWHFLTGERGAIERVAAAVGFRSAYDEQEDQIAHPAGITLATPAGRIARYLLGVAYEPLDLRLGLAEASDGKIAAPASHLLLLCYGYDPATGRYGFLVNRAVVAASIATAIALAIAILALLRNERRRAE